MLKARGIAHSNQVREFLMDDHGIRLLKPYLGENGALTGSARRAEEARARRAELLRTKDVARREREIEARRRKALAQIEVLKAELEADGIALAELQTAERIFQSQAESDLQAMIASRRA